MLCSFFQFLTVRLLHLTDDGIYCELNLSNCITYAIPPGSNSQTILPLRSSILKQTVHELHDRKQQEQCIIDSKKSQDFTMQQKSTPRVITEDDISFIPSPRQLLVIQRHAAAYRARFNNRTDHRGVEAESRAEKGPWSKILREIMISTADALGYRSAETVGTEWLLLSLFPSSIIIRFGLLSFSSDR